VQQQLGNARIDTTTIYTQLAARLRLAVHATVAW
jgi:site-specific recombinase XerD